MNESLRFVWAFVIGWLLCVYGGLIGAGCIIHRKGEDSLTYRTKKKLLFDLAIGAVVVIIGWELILYSM